MIRNRPPPPTTTCTQILLIKGKKKKTMYFFLSMSNYQNETIPKQKKGHSNVSWSHLRFWWIKTKNKKSRLHRISYSSFVLKGQKKKNLVKKRGGEASAKKETFVPMSINLIFIFIYIKGTVASNPPRSFIFGIFTMMGDKIKKSRYHQVFIRENRCVYF